MWQKSRHGLLCLEVMLGILRMVGVVLYKIFAMLVTYKKEDHRKTIVGNKWDMDIGTAADALEI